MAFVFYSPHATAHSHYKCTLQNHCLLRTATLEGAATATACPPGHSFVDSERQDGGGRAAITETT